jgi:hypothetical protein
MPDFKVLEVFEHFCHLVLKVEHYNPDGSFWFLEHYFENGAEGLIRKRKANDQGQLLMDNGEVAPLVNPNPPIRRPGVFRAEDYEQYLPDGREWVYHPAPWLDEQSLLSTVRSIHRQRLQNPQQWQGKIDVLPKVSFKENDQLGCSVLMNKFRYLIGREFDV